MRGPVQNVQAVQVVQTESPLFQYTADRYPHTLPDWRRTRNDFLDKLLQVRHVGRRLAVREL
jgi:hypothetical protein